MLHKSLFPLDENHLIRSFEQTIKEDSDLVKQNFSNYANDGFSKEGFFTFTILNDEKMCQNVTAGDIVNFGGILFRAVFVSSKKAVFINKYPLLKGKEDLTKAITDIFLSHKLFEIEKIRLPKKEEIVSFGSYANIGVGYWTETTHTIEDTILIVTPKFKISEKTGLMEAGGIQAIPKTSKRYLRPVIILKNANLKVGSLIDFLGYTWYVFEKNKIVCDTVIGKSTYSSLIFGKEVFCASAAFDFMLKDPSKAFPQIR